MACSFYLLGDCVRPALSCGDYRNRLKRTSTGLPGFTHDKEKLCCMLKWCLIAAFTQPSFHEIIPAVWLRVERRNFSQPLKWLVIAPAREECQGHVGAGGKGIWLGWNVNLNWQHRGNGRRHSCWGRVQETFSPLRQREAPGHHPNPLPPCFPAQPAWLVRKEDYTPGTESGKGWQACALFSAYAAFPIAQPCRVWD